MQFLTTAFAAAALVSSVAAAPAAEVNTLEARTLYGHGKDKQYGFRCNAPGKPIHGKWIKPTSDGYWGVSDTVDFSAYLSLNVNVNAGAYGILGYGSNYPQCMKYDSYGKGHGLIPIISAGVGVNVGVAAAVGVAADVAVGVGAAVGAGAIVGVGASAAVSAAVAADIALGISADVEIQTGKWAVYPAFPSLDILDIFGSKHWLTWDNGCKTCTWKCYQDKDGKWGFTWWDNQVDFALLHVELGIKVVFDVTIEIVKKSWWTLPYGGSSYGSPSTGGGYGGLPSIPSIPSIPVGGDYSGSGSSY